MKRSEACSACKVRPRRVTIDRKTGQPRKQRYCAECHNESEKARRAQIAADLADYRRLKVQHST